MIWVQLSASVFTLLAIWFFTNKYEYWGTRTGFIGQCFWLWVIFGNDPPLWGLLPADGVIFFLYIKRVIKDIRRDRCQRKQRKIFASK